MKAFIGSFLLGIIGVSSHAVLCDEQHLDENGNWKVTYPLTKKGLSDSARVNRGRFLAELENAGVLDDFVAAGWDHRKIERGDIQQRISDIMFKYTVTTNYNESQDAEEERESLKSSPTLSRASAKSDDSLNQPTSKKKKHWYNFFKLGR